MVMMMPDITDRNITIASDASKRHKRKDIVTGVEF